MLANQSKSPKTDEAGEAREFIFRRQEFDYLAQVIYDRSGIVLGEHKLDMVYSRLARRLRKLGVANFQDYCDLLKGLDAEAEIGALINAVTTNLTSFFRESEQFPHLRHELLCPLVEQSRRGGPRHLRIWSAACSSGEEPYSIAMTVAASLPDIARWEVRILATDLDTNMVDAARAGVYKAKDAGGIPKALMAKFVHRQADGEKFEMSPKLKKLIVFRNLNLLHAWPMKGPFDAIFCRNVMIYFDKPTRNKTLDRMTGLLRPGGMLYLGHSESLLGDTPRLEISGNSIYRRRA